MSNCKRSGRVSVNKCGAISHLHRIEGQQDVLKYQHILHNVMVPSVRIIYPEDIIHLQQEISTTHDSCVVQEWLSRQAEVQNLD